MQKILIIFILISLPVFALNSYNDKQCNSYLQTAKLSKRQKAEIEQIEKEYNKKIVELGAQITLKNMQAAQLRNTQQKSKIYAINNEVKQLESIRYNTYKEKDKEILSVLNIFQKIKYRNCISK